MNEIRYYDLFGGIGGFRQGLTRADPRFKCVGYADIDKHAVGVYSYQFQEDHQPTDVRILGKKDIPKIDLLCAGFPCQDLSSAGKKLGFEGERSVLFFEIIRILRDKKPRMVFLENVKGFFSSNEGEDFRIAIKSLVELGYGIEWRVFNSRCFNVPQHRERVFIVGHLGKQPSGTLLSIGEIGKKPDERNGQAAVRPLTAGGHSGGLHSNMTLIVIQRDHQFSTSIHNGYTGALTSARTDKIPCIVESGSIGGRVYAPDGCGRTLMSNGGGWGVNTGLYQIDGKIRRLTPVECERLQSFPDNWTKAGIIEGKETAIAESHRYRLLGNSVTVNVIESIGRAMAASIS